MIEKIGERNSILFVDLDGSLIATDTLFESIIIFLKNNPFQIIYLLLWYLKGKVYLKNQLSQRAMPNVATLPYNKEVLDYIRKEKLSGQQIILATASHKKTAIGVADFLGIFDGVIATDKYYNLKGKRKLDVIQDFACGQSFDYIGDSKADISIWKAARKAIVVNPSPDLLRRIGNNINIHTIRTAQNQNWARKWLRGIRIH